MQRVQDGIEVRRGDRARQRAAEGELVEPPKARHLARIVVGAAMVALGLWVARDYLIALAWAAVLTVAVWPLYRRAAAMLPGRAGRTFVPLAFTVLCAVALLVPLGLAAYEIGQGGQAALRLIAEAQQNGLPAPEWVAQLPLAGSRAADWWNRHLGTPEAAQQLAGSINTSDLAGWTGFFGAQVGGRAVTFLVTAMGVFFLLRDGAWLAGRIHALAAAWLGRPGERLVDRIEAAVRGTIVGIAIVAVGEGALVTIGYFVAGVPAPLLFGALTIACAMVPFCAWAAFGIAALFLVGSGKAFAGLALFAYGAAVMLVGDNLAQPTLVGGRIRLPFVWAMVGIFGGLSTFGLLGLFLGPVIMSALLTIWREWIDPAADEARPAGA